MRLNYETNAAQYDFPPYDSAPQVQYAIASTPRCGSNMLTRGLWLTWQAGAPEEYLAPRYVEDYDQRYNFLDVDTSSFEAWKNGQKATLRDVQQYINLLYSIRTSPNGVFGIKIHATHLYGPGVSSLHPVSLLAPFKIIRLKRRDQIRQGISHTIARHTSVWIDDREWLAKKTPERQPEYNFSEVHANVRYLRLLEDTWDSILRDKRIQSLTVYYEDLCDRYGVIIDSIFEYLQVKRTGRLPEPNIARQATAINDNWYKWYIRDSRESALTSD